MKGEFRNGTFVDDEYQEYRHIQYDLDPEKMEKIWVCFCLTFSISDLTFKYF